MSLLTLQAMGGPPRPLPGSRLVHLPRAIDWIEGQPIAVWWKGLVYLRSLTGYTFTFSGPGASDANHWYWTSPTVGSRRLTISVFLSGTLVGRATTVLRVHAATGATGTTRVNLNGDSITAEAGSGDNAYPNRVKSLLAGTGLTVTLHGSQTAASADAGVVQEGWPGRTYAWFRSDPASPYASGGAAYVTANGAGTPFTDIALMLGTNDMSGLGGSESLWPGFADDIATDAEALLAIVRAGSPLSRVYISLVYDFSDDVADWADAATLDAYYTRHKLVTDSIFRQFQLREAEKIYLLATHVALDPDTHFTSNSVHPNALGHPCIARTVAGAILGAYS